MEPSLFQLALVLLSVVQSLSLISFLLLYSGHITLRVPFLPNSNVWK